ncbi:MAG: DUF1573 domain-containing protein [Muribaculaceae bacterium]
MKRLFLIMLTIVCVTAISQSAERNNSFSPDKVTHNFGNIEEFGGVVKHTFVYTNRGNKAVAIANATAHCTCTKVSFPKQPIRPGEKANITVSFDPENRPGAFSKSIQIRLSDGTYAAVCRISGKVIEAERTVEQRFPYDMGNGLRADSPTIDFSGARQGSTSSMFVRIINTGKKPLDIRFSISPANKAFDVPPTCYLRPGAETLMAVSFTPSAQTRNLKTTVVQPTVGGKKLKTIALKLP